MSDLKPCPFCGETHEWEENQDLHWGRNWTVSCGKVILLTAYTDWERKTLTEFWNTRPRETALDEQLELEETHLDKAEKVIHVLQDVVVQASILLNAGAEDASIWEAGYESWMKQYQQLMHSEGDKHAKEEKS